jgi:ribonucleoside-diphosphate reductase alpha chain
MQFESTIHKWHTCKGTARQNSTNPCSEYLFLDNTACNLASLNLMKFKSEDGTFDVEKFKAAVRIYITAQEIVVDNASYPTKFIAENSHIFRTLGLGYANLGALIMSYGHGYDSPEGRALAGSITSIMTGHAYEQSARIAGITGPFPGYHDSSASGVEKPVAPDNVEPMLDVMQLHRDAVEKIEKAGEFEFLRNEARQVWDEALRLGKQQGYRNAQVTVLAPTGTIGFLMDCDTTGIEPDIALVKYKLLAGGGMLKIVNRGVGDALKRLGYNGSESERILAHVEKFDTIEDVTLTKDDADVKDGRAKAGDKVASGLRPEHLEVFDCAFKAYRGERSIHYKAHLSMMAASQPFISGAISKTVNMPNDATAADIRNAYVDAWRMGLKCVAIYRDGSKRSQPLNTSKAGATENGSASEQVVTLETRIKELESEVARLRDVVNQPLRKRLPETRMAVNHKFEIAGHEGYLTVGLFEDGQPGELFVTMAKEGSTIGGLMDTIGALTSMSLQYGVPLESLVRKFAHQRFEPSGFTRNPDIRNASSIIDYVFRWMACQFVEGYRAANSPSGGQAELPMPGLLEELKKKVNRPVPELPVVEGNTEILVKASAGTSGSSRIYAAAPAGTSGSLLTSTFKNQGDAPTCPTCGHVTVRNGACYKCLNCGASLGCS